MLEVLMEELAGNYEGKGPLGVEDLGVNGRIMGE
jgi:hypothetical protein